MSCYSQTVKSSEEKNISKSYKRKAPIQGFSIIQLYLPVKLPPKIPQKLYSKRKWQSIFPVLKKKKKLSSRILNLTGISFRTEGEIESF